MARARVEPLPLERGPKSDSISSLIKGAPRFDGDITRYLMWKREFYIYFNGVMWVRDILWGRPKPEPIYKELQVFGPESQEEALERQDVSTPDADPPAPTETGGTTIGSTAHQASTAPQQITPRVHFVRGEHEGQRGPSARQLHPHLRDESPRGD